MAAAAPKVPGPKTPGLMTPYKQKGDNVAAIATGIMATKSPLMKQAETAGMQQANRRGLLNSSMAVGAAQAEGYKVAVPMALQQAQQGAAANLSNQGFEQDRVLTDVQEAGQNTRLDKSLTSSERIATLQETGANTRQDKTISSDKYLANLSETGANTRQTQQLTSQERVSAADRAATIARADSDRRAQLTIADWNLDAADRQGAMQTLTSFEQLYDERVKAINANKNLKGKDRQKQLDGLAATQTKRRDLVRQIYDMKITW